MLVSETQKRVFTALADKLPRCGKGWDTSHDGVSAYSIFFNTANGGVNGPLSTRAEKAFSQIGPALRFNSAGVTVGVETAVGEALVVSVMVAGESGVALANGVGRDVAVVEGKG